MKRKMSYRNMERVYSILTRNVTNEPLARWETAERKRLLRVSLESINEAREDPDEIKKYKKERYRILGKYGIHIGGDQFSIKPENADIVQEEILALKEKYFSALDAEDKRIDGIEELLDKTKEIDIEPINYEWLGDAINSNDVEILMELDLVNRPNDNDDPDRSSGNCNKRLGKK